MEQRKMVGKILPQRGHSLFEFDTTTCHLRRVAGEEFEKDLVASGRTFRLAKSFEAKQSCVYISALNFKNAVKKISKYYGVEVKL